MLARARDAEDGEDRASGKRGDHGISCPGKKDTIANNAMA
jgi:hypothetical protein